MDPVLQAIVATLRKRYGCHTALLYGSRARGGATAMSDYDVVGIRRSGAMTRLAKKSGGFYWDVFVYPEKDLRKLGDAQLTWKGARVLFERGRYGRDLVARVERHCRAPFKPAPRHEIAVAKVWSRKQLERSDLGDTHGLYRRTELQMTALADYFLVRRMRYPGPKAALEWMQAKDPATFRAFDGMYRKPADGRALRRVVSRVYGR
jgi:uncharacterized protein